MLNLLHQPSPTLTTMWTYRSWQLFCAWAFVGACYTLASLWPSSAPWVIQPSFVDDAIGFQALWLPVYVSFFVFIPYGFFTLPHSVLPVLRTAFQACGVLSALVFIAFPTTLVYPNISTAIPSMGAWWAWWHQMDTPQNCLPSLHASLTTMVWLAVLRSPQAACKQRILMTVWYGLILFSILACKRHFALDVAAGMVLGGICFALSLHGFNTYRSSVSPEPDKLKTCKVKT
ncbi:MAG: phosphatase PAP2 family protein [Vitreoscilla sp.]|nr:phosphatase PAP2 family protein [Vitreoscilla sp.]MBP9541014.1 phosphatase PAP2 family protein [Vitreoscilla sp.]